MNKIVQEKVLGDNRRITILNTNIDVLTMDQTVNLVEKYVKVSEPLHLIGVNADKINVLNKDKKMREIVNSCGVINADGASVVLASKYLKKPLPERVAGIDLMQNLIALSCKKGYTVYLLGAKASVVNKTAEVLENKFSDLIILGKHDGYFKKTEWPEISKQLKKLQPDFVFVGITSPTKEYLVEYLQSQGNKSVFMGVGGSFDVISGNIPRAPRWMQQVNLEWLFRVMQEPKRLFKRYFIGNGKFIKNVISEKRSSDH